MSQPAPAPKRPRHLIDPNNPRAHMRPDRMHVSQVQKWVMSVLATTTILHLSVGIGLAAFFLAEGRPGAEAGLLVIAAAFGIIAVAVGFLIHGRSLVTPWLLTGTIPALIMAWLIFN